MSDHIRLLGFVNNTNALLNAIDISISYEELNFVDKIEIILVLLKENIQLLLNLQQM